MARTTRPSLVLRAPRSDPHKCIGTRRLVKVALLTDSLTIARERRDALMDADEYFWESSLDKHMDAL